jgi:hypothetical protein
MAQSDIYNNAQLLETTYQEETRLPNHVTIPNMIKYA